MRPSEAIRPRIRRPRNRRAQTPHDRPRRRSPRIARRRRSPSKRASRRRSRPQADGRHRSRTPADRRRRSIRRRPSTPTTESDALPTPKKRPGASLSREFRKDLVGKRPFRGFPKGDFALAALIFWQNGYFSVDMVRDVDAKERDLPSHETKRDSRGGRSALSDPRLTLKIFPWYEPRGRIRTDNAPYNEVCVGERMRKRAVDLSRIGTWSTISPISSKLGGPLTRP